MGVAVVLGMGLTTRGTAQLTIAGVRDLAFGSVIQGVPSLVAPNDPIKSGQFDIQAPLGNRLRIDFTLPARLIGPAGARLPITFSKTDCILLETGPGGVPVVQNPKTNKAYTMTYGNRLLVFLGGKVTPRAAQATGAYSASVILTVTIL